MEQEQRQAAEKTRQKKNDSESITDTIKEKVTGTAKTIKEGVTSTVGEGDNVQSKSKDLESAQLDQNKIGEASSDPKTSGPTDNVREKAAETTDESEDSEEPA